MAATLLMCSPESYGVEYEINPWMQKQVGCVDTGLAKRQWAALHDVLSAFFAIRVMPAVSGWPDLVFTANAGLVIPDSRQIILSTFRHPERQGELIIDRAWFEADGWSCQTLPAGVAFEGAGDALFDDQGRLWLSDGPRTDKAALACLRELVGTPVENLRLVDANYYHLDTCFCPLARGYALAFLPAFDMASQQVLQTVFGEQLLAISPDEAKCFAANAVCRDDIIVMNSCSPRLKSLLAASGFSVLTTPLSEFIKSGGSAKCLTLALS